MPLNSNVFMRCTMARTKSEPVRRRSFLTQIGTAGVAATAIGLGAAGTASAQTGARFQAARHPQDDWMDALPGKHRLYLDALTGPGAGEALLFGSNFLN